MNQLFKLDRLMRKINTVKLSYKKSDLPSRPTGDYTLPARTATSTNLGISCYVPRDGATVLKDKISVSANGKFSAFWHDKEFTILADAYALEGKGFSLNKGTATTIIASMYKALSLKYDWDYKSGWERIKDEEISLPVLMDKNGNFIFDSHCHYHDQGFQPDFDAMQESITGKDDVLSQRVRRFLLASESHLDSLLLKEDALGFAQQTKQYHSFRLDALFAITGTKGIDAGKIEFSSEGIHFVGRTNSDNGVQGKLPEQEFKPNKGKTITATVIGNYKYAKYQEEPYYCSQNINKLTPKFEINRELGLWFCCGVQKFLDLYQGEKDGYKLEDIQRWELLIPVETNDKGEAIIDEERKFHPAGYTPDWDYIKSYMAGIERKTLERLKKRIEV